MTTASQPGNGKLPPKTGEPILKVLPRVDGRISFCFVDRVRIRRNEFGVVARLHSKEHGTEEVELPVAKLAVLMIGPGTSITQPALAMTTKSGCAVVSVGHGGIGASAVALPSGGNSVWLEKPVASWADPKGRVEVAKRLYRMRFPTDPGDGSIERLRGLEGANVREAYRRLAKKHGISFRRSYKLTDWEDADPVNRALSTANHLLYGIVQTALVAVGCHPGLGFIHTGTNRAFVFDIADLYKLDIAAPAAFACHDADNPEGAVRAKMRHKVSDLRLLSRLVPDIQHCLDPSQARRPFPKDALMLWDPEHGKVAGGINYEDSELLIGIEPYEPEEGEPF